MELAAIVERFEHPRILLIGDFMVDRYIYGDAERLSYEAPVPVVRERRRESRAGGAGNVAADLSVLGAEVLCTGLRGDDAPGEALLEMLKQIGARTEGVIASSSRPTSCKTRIVGLAQHRHPQQMLRLDQEDTSPISASEEDSVFARISEQMPTCELICIEDYHKGLITPSLCRRVLAEAGRVGKPVMVDPAPIEDYTKYRGATVITPNRTEAERATGINLRDGVDAAPDLAETLLRELDLEACVLTLDRQGMYLLERGKPGEQRISTRPRTVYDSTGAGDMVLAMLAMARAYNATWTQAVDLANIAGGLEVERFGCVPITRQEVLDEVLHETGRRKQRSLPDLLVELDRHRMEGKSIVFTNGCFDILHAGHVQYLRFARRQGDLLVVGVNGDDSVTRLKGVGRPIFPLVDRLEMLAGLEAVDYVIPFDADTPRELIAAIRPDVLVKGQDYEGREVVGRDLVEARGGRVALAPFLAGRSTSQIVAKIGG